MIGDKKIMPILTEIPFELNMPALLKRAHVPLESTNAAEFAQLVQQAVVIGKPKAGYREAFIENKGDATVKIEGVNFQSRMLRNQLEHAERVFPFLVSCGRELDQAALHEMDLL